MMRYQRVSPDCLPFSNGKKSNLRTITTTTTCKDEGENGKTVPNNNGFDANFDGGKWFRFRSPSRAQENNHHHHRNNGATDGAPNSPPLIENDHNNTSNTNNKTSQRLDISPSTGGGDVLLQWGQKKRARLSRTEIRSMTDDSSSSSSILRRQPLNKVQRKGSGLMDKLSAATLPPQPPPSLPLPSNGGSIGIASNLRSKDTSGFIHGRNMEERSGVAANGSPSRNSGSSIRAAAAAASRSTAVKASPSSPDKIDKKVPGSGSRKEEKQQPNGSLARAAADHHHHHATPGQSEQETGANNNNNTGVEKVNVVEVIEWPKIYVSLSRKEKEDDFLAIKGTKLTQRPKKRAKNVDRNLQYCFPGMWLSDLTKSRYEVREKKSVKKQKIRGLKGMESMESDSE